MADNESFIVILGGTFTSMECAQLYQLLSSRTLRRLQVSPQLKSAVTPLGKIINQSRLPLSKIDRLQARFLCNLVLCNIVAVT